MTLAAILTLVLAQKPVADQPVNVNVELPEIRTDGASGNINLRDLQGGKQLVLFFFSEQCGVTFYYKERIRQIQKEFEPNGFVFVGIRGGKRQNPNEPLKVAESNYLNMRFGDDRDGRLIRQFGVGQSVTFAVIDSAGILRYQGGLDDNVSAKQVKVPYLRNSLTSLVKGQPVRQKTGPSLGCAIIPIR